MTYNGCGFVGATCARHKGVFLASTTDELGPLGVRPHVVEECLSHVTVFKQGVAGRYNLAAYRDDKRKALTPWNELRPAAIEGRDAKVVPIKQTAS